MKTRIHVNQHVLRANKTTGTDNPVFTVKRGKSNTYAREVRFTGPSTLVYRPEKPLSCGATAWIETECDVELVT